MKKYRDPNGRTLLWPTFVYFLGDICGFLCLLSIIGGIVSIVNNGFDVVILIVAIVWIIVFYALMTALHKMAEKSAEKAYLKIMDRQERRTSSKKSN